MENPFQRVEKVKICEHCGNRYVNFCVKCRRRKRQELVEELMDKYALDDENLIRLLSEHVYNGNFPALSLAIAIKDMKPGAKAEVTGADGGPIEIREARERLASILANFPLSGGKGEGDSDDGAA